MLMDIKLSEVQLSKIIQSSGLCGKSLGNVMGNLDKNVLLDLGIHLAKDVLPKLGTKATLSASDKFERKISGKGAVRTRKVLTLYILPEDIEDTSNIKESLEYSGIIIGGTTETARHEIKKQEGEFLLAMMAPSAAPLISPMASSLMNGITGKGVMRAEEKTRR